MSADINVSSVRAHVQTAASNLPLALTVKVVKGAEGTLCNVPYAFPDISAATIQARAMAVGAAAFPLTWNRSYAPPINASSNTLSAGVTDSQLVVSGCVGYGSNSVLMSRYLQDYGASVSLLQTSNRYYLVSTEGGNTFFSVGASNDGRLTYGLSNSAFGASTACVMQRNFGLGTCNLAVGLCNPVLGSVAPTLKSAWNLSNVTYFPQGAWNLKPPIVAAGGLSYTDSNYGLAVALSNYTSFPDAALSFSVTSNTNANVPFSTAGANANVLTLSGGHAAVAAGSNTGTLTLSVVNSLDTTGFAVACNVAVPYTVFALAPAGTNATPSSLKLGTTGAAYTLSNLAGYVTARAGGAYTYAVLGDSNPYGNVSVDAATGALTIARLTCNVTYAVGVKVTDQFSQPNTQSIPLISVRPPAAIGAPSALALGSTGSAYVLSGFPGFFATQPSGDPYVYSVSTNPRGNVSVNASTGALTIGRLGINATYTAGVTLTDGVAQSVTQSIVLTSVPPATVNGALNAVVKSSSNSSFPTFSSVGFNVMTGGTYSYALTTNQLNNAVVNAETGALTVTGVSGCNAVYSVGVSAIDQFFQASQRLVTLTSVPPLTAKAVVTTTVKSLSNILIPTFGSVGFNLMTGGNYSYSVTTNQLNNAVINAGTGALTLTGVSGCNAIYSVGVYAVDQFSQSSQTSMTVTSVPPATVNAALSAVVKSSSNVSLPTFGSAGFNLMTGGTYVYSLTTNQLTNAVVNAGTGALTVTGVSGCNAVYSVGVSAVDQLSQASQRLITLTSVPPPTANGTLAATVKSLSNVSLPTFGSSGFSLKTGGTYTYSLTTDQLSNAAVSAGTGALTVTGVSGCNAVYSVGVTAVDQFSQSVQQAITLTSVPPPTANATLSAVVKSLSNVSLPTFGGSAGFNLKTGGTYVYSVTTNQLSNAAVNAGTGALTVTGVSGCNAVYSVGVTAVDQFTQSDQRLITLTSVPPPTANGALVAIVKSLSNVSLPTFGGSAGFNLKTGGTYAYSVTTDQLSNAVVDAGTGALTVTGVSGCNAIYSVGVTAVDQFAQSDQRLITLTSVPPPTANATLSAVVKSLSNVSLPTFGGSAGFNLKTGGTYVYSLTTNQLSNAVVDAGTGALTVTGVSGCNAVYSVGVSAVDQFSQSDQRLVTLTSVPPPTAKGTLVATVKSLSNVSLPLFGSSGFNLKTGGTYTYSLTTDQLSNAAVIAGTGALTVTGVSGCNAVYSVGVTAVDQFAQSAQQTIALTSVIPPAAIGSPSALVLGTTGEAYLLSGFASYFAVQPGGAPYVYSVSTNPRGNVSVDATTGAVTIARLGINATYTAGVTLTDGLAQSVTQSIGMTSVLPPAVATPFPATTIGGSATSYSLNVASYFSSTGTIVSYAVSANPQNNASISGGLLTVNRAYTGTTYNVVVTATDQLSQTSFGNTLVVTDAAALYALNDGVVGTVAFGAGSTYGQTSVAAASVAALFSYSGVPAITYSLFSTPYQNATVVAGGGALTVYNAGSGGSYTVVVKATNSTLTAYSTLTVTENAIAPTVVTEVPQIALATNKRTFQLSTACFGGVTYVAAGAATYALTANPYGNAVIDTQTGYLTVTGATRGGQWYTVAVRATNASGQFADATISVVEPPVGSGLLAMYTGESWSTTGGGWLDAYGANHATAITGTVTKSATSINGRAYLSGGYNTSTLQFPSAILPSTYTLFSLSRYNGAVKGRVLTAQGPTNWLTGHYGGLSGVAFHEGWMTPVTESGIGSNWLLSSDQNTLYKCNGLNRTNGTGSAYATGIGFNVNNEPSDWASAFVLVYNGTLSAAQISSVEAWIAGVYNIPLATSSVPATILAVGSPSTLQLSSYFSGAPTSYGAFVTSGTAPAGAVALTSSSGALAISPAYAGASYSITPVATNATSMAVGNAFAVSDPRVTTQSGWLSQVYSGYFADDVTFFATAPLLQSVYTTDTTNLSTCTNAYLAVNNAALLSVQMTGFYLASTTGTYTITLASDDAGYLWMGDSAIAGYTVGNALINVGGGHPVILVSGTYAMTAGSYYPVRVQYGDGGGGSDLQISFTPPGGAQTYVGTGAYFAPPPMPLMPPISLPPGCRCLYSLHLLNADYAGPVVGCRRSSDSATSDFYNVNGQLCTTPAGTTTTITAWLAGGSTAYVATWYDQSGAGKNATMATAGTQPYVNVGAMRVTFPTSTYLSMPDGTIPYGNATYTVTVKHGALSGNAGIWGSGTYSGAGGTTNALNTTGSYYNNYWWGDDLVVTWAPSDGNVVTCKYDQTARYMYVNGAQIGTRTNVALRNSTPTNNTIGCSQAYTQFLNGDIYYLAIFADSLSDQSRLTVEGLYSTSAMSRVLNFDGQTLASVGAGNAITTWANTSGLLGTSYAATAYNSPLAGAVTSTAVAFPPFAMTANTSSPGSGTYLASASSSYGAYGEDVWNAFDSVAGTQWTIGTYTWYNNGAYVASTTTTIDGVAYKGEWIQFKMPYTAKATSYSIKTHPTDASRCPSAWALAGSVDGASWVLLDTRTGQTTVANTQYSYATMSTTTSGFSHFRLVTTALVAAGGQAWYSLQDFRVYAAPVRYHAGFVGANSQYFNITKPLPFTWFSNAGVYAGLTVFVVAQLTATTGVTWERFFDFANAAANDNILFSMFGLYTLTLNTWNGEVQSTHLGVNFTPETTSFHVFAFNINNTETGYTAAIYVDGCTATSAAVYGSGTIATPIVNRTTVNNYIGRSNWDIDAYLCANVRQIAMYNSSLSAPDMALAYQQITSRWGMYLDGSTPQRAAKSAAAIKTLTGTNVDGAYWIDLPTVGATQVYCIMDSAVSGGGWMLALKTAATGTTFSYASTHWTTATTTLNPTDATRGAGDAKFDTFNYFASADVLALWPDILTTGGTISLPASYGCWCWLKTAYNSGTRQALASFFSTASNVSFGTAAANPPRFPEAGANVFSQQAGAAFYGANFTLHAPASVRWGFAFNNEGDWTSNDVMGGIGLVDSWRYGNSYSSGDVLGAAQSATGINRQARAEMYVR